MYNLLRFFIRYHLFLLFILLEAACFFLIYRNNKYHQVAYINVANDVTGKVNSVYKSWGDYFNLQKMNDSLVRENALLHERLPESKYDNHADSGSKTITDGRYTQVYHYISARVIRNSVNTPNNIIYIDRGRLLGVDKQMGVISPAGIVGHVISVTDHYAAVMSVLNKDFRISAKLKGNESFGNLRWDGLSTTTAILEEVSKHYAVKPGDTVVTSGYSEMFPRNVMIGVVKKVKATPEKQFLDIVVSLSADFGSLNYVYVINNMNKQEITTLDSLTTSAPTKK